MDSSGLNGFLSQLPAGTPPPGVQSDFIDPPTQTATLIALNVVFLAIMLSCISIRIWVRGFVVHAFGWDDYTAIIAAAGSVTHSCLMFNSFQYGFGWHMWDIRASVLVDVNNVRLLNSMSLLYPILIFFVKLSLLLLYYRIFAVADKGLRIAIYAGIAFLAAFHISCLAIQIASVVQCVNLQSLVLYPVCQHVYDINVYQSALMLATDVFVLLLPIHRVVKLQVRRRKKIGLLLIFGAGVVSCLVSVARLVVFVVTFSTGDTFWTAGLCAMMTIVEVNVAIAASCMPVMPTFFVRLKLIGQSVYKSLRSHKSSGTESSTLPTVVSSGKEKGTFNTTEVSTITQTPSGPPPTRVSAVSPHDESWLQFHDTPGPSVTVTRENSDEDVRHSLGVLKTTTYDVNSRPREYYQSGNFF